MTHETFYAGGNEYYIIYKNGTHQINKVGYFDNGELNPEVVFTGHYDKCLEEKDRIVSEYLESLY